MLNQNLLLTGDDGYNLSRSLRFRASASAFLSRTPATAGNQKTWTWSAWIKRGSITTPQWLFAGGVVSTDYTLIRFGSGGGNNDNLEYVRVTSSAINAQKISTAVYRDTASWYHIVVTEDALNSVARVYVNGNEITYSTNTNPTNVNGAVNAAVIHNIGRYTGSNIQMFDGYMAEVNFIDGQALTPSSFGSINSSTGVWQPKKYEGTYGTNGFYLNFTTNTLNTLLSTSANISAPFGGVATNALVADGVYCTSNTSTGSAFTFLLNDFGTPTQVSRYSISNLFFTGGVSTFSIQGSADNSSWTTVATLSTNGSPQNFSGALNRNFRYWRLAPTAFGTNGTANVDQFVLFQDGIGVDSSLNGNIWTPNNISVTAGATYDSMTDVPTLTSTTASNYCVMNPLAVTTSTGTLSGANLFVTTILTGGGNSFGSIALPTSGKYYWEVTPTASAGACMIGVSTISTASSYFWQNTDGSLGYYDQNGNRYLNGGAAAYGATYAVADVIGTAVDLDAGTVTFYKNNTSQGAITFNARGLFPAVSDGSGSGGSSAFHVNFGQRPFAYTPPTGFVALNTFNLPNSSVVAGHRHMDINTYTGTGSALNIVNSGAMQPDLVWIKSRSVAGSNHELYDSVRGVGQFISSSTAGAEATISQAVTSFNANGFSLGNGTSSNSNTSGASLVGWQWKAGGTAVTNTAGTITSQVSANPSAGFSVVTFAAQATAGTVGHGLGVAPSMILMKDRTSAFNWLVYHRATGTGKYTILNSTAAVATTVGVFSTLPTSSVFDPGTGVITGNGYANQVAYCFSEVAGFSSFGSYIGNGSNDGAFVYTGFRPKFVLYKRTDSTENWVILDTTRNVTNVMSSQLYPNLSNAEGTGASNMDILSNGFKLRSGAVGGNGSGATFMYMAFAENPFKHSLAR